MPYWFNVDTGQVETDDTRSQDATVPLRQRGRRGQGPGDRARQHREVGPRGTGSGASGRLGRRVPGGLRRGAISR